MVQTTLPPRRPLTRSTLIERAALGTPSAVDESAGVLRGVKVLGLESRNGRRYMPEAVRSAAPLYEGAAVRVDHPDDPDAQRPVSSTIGWLRNIRFIEGRGLYGDLHVLTTHPLSKQLFEAARRNPRLLGLSHNATGDCDREGRTLVVRAITEVRSVDLVSDPATTRGLFESYQGATMPQPQLFDTPTDPDAGSGGESPDAALRKGFRAAMIGVLDGQGDKKTKLGKLRDLLAAAEKLLDAGEDIPEEEEPVDNPDAEADAAGDHAEPDGDEEQPLEEAEGADYCPPKKKNVDGQTAMEGLQRKLTRAEAKLAVYRLCESMGVQPPPVVVEAAVKLADHDARRELLEAYRTRQPDKAKTGKPRSGVAGLAVTTDEIDDITDSKSFAAALLRGARS